MSESSDEELEGATENEWTAVTGTLPFQGRFDLDSLRSVTEQLMAYEDWVGEGRPDTIDHIPELPRWFLGAAYWNPTAFEFMRHSAMSYLFQAQTTGPSFGGTFLSLIRRIRETQPDSYTELAETIREAHDEFDRQHNNARRNQQRMLTARDEERLEIALQWYVSFFETNIYLWFLCVLGRYMQSGRVEPQAFGGPLTATAQGELVRQALELLAGTPLHRIVGYVFDTELRNAVGHNDYELTLDRSRTLVLHPGERTLSWDETWELLLTAQNFHQGMLNAIATLMTSPRAEDWPLLREYGVTTLDWHIRPPGPVEVILYQLWCFAELDPDGCWLDATDFTICDFPADGPDGSAVRFGTVGFVHVPDDSGLDILRATLEEDPWILVTRYPIAPFLGLGFPHHGDEFEIVGTPDEHIARYAGVMILDPSDLPPRSERDTL